MRRPSPPGKNRKLSRAAVLVVLAAAVCFCGCVRRRLTVRTNPPGAMVYVDNQAIGRSPISTDFTYYGTREIRMVKAGYETLTVNQPIPTPWYQVPGVDFFSENLLPFRVRDNRVVNFNMTPQPMIPPDELIGRGEQLRAAANAPIVTPAGGAADPFSGSTLTPQVVPPSFTPEPMPTPPPTITPETMPAPPSTPPAETPTFGPPPATSTPPNSGAAPFRY